jgi:hypothetical protein
VAQPQPDVRCLWGWTLFETFQNWFNGRSETMVCIGFRKRIGQTKFMKLFISKKVQFAFGKRNCKTSIPGGVSPFRSFYLVGEGFHVILITDNLRYIHVDIYPKNHGFS